MSCKIGYHGTLLLSFSLIPLLFLPIRTLAIDDSGSNDEFSVRLSDKSLGCIRGLSCDLIAVKKIDKTFISERISGSQMKVIGESAYMLYTIGANGRVLNSGRIKGSFTVEVKYPRSLETMAEKGLKILVMSGNKWKLIPSKVDTSKRCVVADNVSELGIYCLVAPADMTLKNVIVYPNPVQFGTFGGVSKELKFLNVPLGSVIEIFNVSGEKIYTISEVASNQVSWNGERDNGDLVTSGLYIYRIKTAGGERYGKIAVVR